MPAIREVATVATILIWPAVMAAIMVTTRIITVRVRCGNRRMRRGRYMRLLYLADLDDIV